MKLIATIKHNDERINRRVSIFITRQSRDGKWVHVIRTGAGAREYANAGSFATRDDALHAIYRLWGAAVWDLQFA